MGAPNLCQFFYKKFLCFLQNYGMIPLDNTCSGKDEVSCLAAKKPPQKNIPKAEKSWILYDWANSVYATNIMAVLFPIYFGSVCAAAGADNLVLWSYGTSVATFITAVLAPFWARWLTTRATRSACSWPVWFWAWPLRCSPP